MYSTIKKKIPIIFFIFFFKGGNLMISPILYRPYLFMLSVGFLPPLIALLTLFLYYYNGHNTEINHLPYISEVAAKLPESRVFSVGINICAWLLLPVFLILDRILKLQNKEAGNSKSPGVLFSRLLMNILDGFAFFSMIGFCSCTLEESRTFHMLCIIVFVISLTCSYFCMDYQMTRSKRGNMTIQRFWTCTIPIIYLFSLLFYKFAKGKALMYSISAIFEYIAAFFLFFKFILIWQNLPRIGLIFTKEAI